MSFLKRLSLGKLKTATAEHLQAFMDFLKKKDNPALLPMQIAYYTGLRIGEVCGLTWQDINLDEQYLTVRRSMRYNGQRHKTEIGATKRKKVRTVDFCDTLADILRKAKTEQHKNRFKICLFPCHSSRTYISSTAPSAGCFLPLAVKPCFS